MPEPNTRPPELGDLLDNLTDMPSLPTVVAQLTRLIANPRTTAAEINTVLSSDPALVARILKLVNSSFYGFSRRITTITNAVVILGFNQVRNLALSAFIFDSFATGPGSASFEMKAFWRHCIGSAFLAAQLARHLDTKLEEDAFICGLLHDLGKFVMVQRVPEHLSMVMREVEARDVLFYEAEAQVLGYNHALLGAMVMERWNLPVNMVDVVRHHHDPLGAPEGARRIACAVGMGDIVARALLMGNGGDAKIPLLTQGVWAEMGLDWGLLEDIIRKVAPDYSRSDAFFA